jgi:uncharacterized oxidoreductase
MVSIPAEKLRKIGEGIFRAQGLSAERTQFLVDTLIEANLTGHDSHGVHYYLGYSNGIKKGSIKPDAEPTIIKETATSAHIDGRWAPGQVTANIVMETAIKKAESQMVSVVGAFNCNHIGRLGYYTSRAAERGVIALMFANVGNPLVSVYNGMGKTFGTNPISVSVPTGTSDPFLVDYATSVVAAGKLSVARASHAKIPTHWAKDKDAGETDDPWTLSKGGWLLPFGEYKGYGLQLVVELLGAVLTGSQSGIDPHRIPVVTNGVLVLAVNADAFIGLEAFKERADTLLERIKQIPSEPRKRIMIPGEPELETMTKRLQEGIPLPKETWKKIQELAGDLGVEL